MPSEVVPITGKGETTAEGSFYRMTDKGLLFEAEPAFTDWALLGRYLGSMQRVIPWLIGDWLNFGEATYHDLYAQAMDETGLEYGTLRNYKYVARAFPIERRRTDISYQHHADVASLPPDKQDAWLADAAREGWTVRDLRYRLSGGTRDGDIGDTPAVNMTSAVGKASDWPGRAREAWDHMTAAQRDEFLEAIGVLVRDDRDD